MAKPSEAEIKKEVRALVAEISERKSEQITDTVKFVEELGIDSLMAMEIRVAVAKKYKIQLSEEEFGEINSVNEATAAVQRHLAKV
jgi:acyl carrier protein